MYLKSDICIFLIVLSGMPCVIPDHITVDYAIFNIFCFALKSSTIFEWSISIYLFFFFNYKSMYIIYFTGAILCIQRKVNFCFYTIFFSTKHTYNWWNLPFPHRNCKTPTLYIVVQLWVVIVYLNINNCWLFSYYYSCSNFRCWFFFFFLN